MPHRHTRQAAVADTSEKSRTKLALGLALGAIAAAGLLGYWRLRPEQPTVQPPAVALPVADGYVMVCKACRASFEMKRDKFDSWPRSDLGFQCPKCGSFKTEPDNSKITPMVEVPGGG